MRGCALRKVVRNLAHKKLENRGVEPQHLPSQILDTQERKAASKGTCHINHHHQ